jgi:hypothetical protein
VDNNPFWGFSWLRQTMSTYRVGATFSLIAAGIALLVIGHIRSPVLDVLGGALIVIGGWPLIAGHRCRRDAFRLEAHARAEDAILNAASDIAVGSAVDAAAGRPGLALLVTENPRAAGVARRACLSLARDEPEDADHWLDAANEIEHAGAPLST